MLTLSASVVNECEEGGSRAALSLCPPLAAL